MTAFHLLHMKNNCRDRNLHAHLDFLTAPSTMYEYLRPSRTLNYMVLYEGKDYYYTPVILSEIPYMNIVEE